MIVNKIRFIEPGNLPYRKSIKNLYTYDKYIRNPSIGLLTLATIVKEVVDDTFMYSESISTVKWDDVLDADIVFIGICFIATIKWHGTILYGLRSMLPEGVPITAITVQ
ncbi:Fe-S oxidoreductase [Clostridium pasteurianum DSM 525 = ATCC 6013]|uniref:Fe-S oxidoreductase n=1 Tax=Clostridium pasteurianum DSM 525 = ATCC 6013 TaxID=1262449 RepID=A0A0H3J6M9_CLOPA|nr:hypothetical protein [Clostridium pasteurianum]AJA49109.1 Fe-S oxidoreductase [Clostridium pasteurianum DSM 525 = ATCC 6013]AJA53097.1 Fe-S oxidoreductase [Clostridium pasteurianum DSM 525 = ATCC 6013]ELP59044.1 Fe-S oxidoreductase [Clostridium pasteurianum DSM 525 = ATCC 6013]KRU10895.1 hypothetical protein CP6013_00142 [Clostridium pasteurianum DSM 525 = ATCC 6013]UZW13418.1 hypothetical protein OSC52_16440 [Clostridium pasteurianum]